MEARRSKGGSFAAALHDGIPCPDFTQSLRRILMTRALKQLFPAALLLFIFSMPLQTELGAQQTKSDSATSPSGPADEVNPFVGSAPVPVAGMRSGVFDTGNTFPGAALPFGMVQWSPDTETGFLKRRSGYIYGDDKIRGFSLTHISGAGCQIFGDV